MRIFNESILSAGDMSQSTLASASVLLPYIELLAVQAVFTGSPVGTIRVEASLDNVNWTLMTGSTVSINGADSIIWNIEEIAFSYLRTVYTKTSGSGSLTVLVTGKGPG